MKKSVKKALKKLGLIVGLAAISIVGHSNITVKAEESVSLRDINGNAVITGENYYLISKGRDYDSYEKGVVSHMDKLTGDYLYVDPSEDKGTPVQIYKSGNVEASGELVKHNDLGYFKMDGKYFNFGVQQFSYVKLKDEKGGDFQFIQQGDKNQMKLVAGVAEISYDSYGRPSTNGPFDRVNVSNQQVYLNASRVDGLGVKLYDDMWVDISAANENMANNYSLKPVPKLSSKQGDVMKFNFYNNNVDNKDSSKNGPFIENGTKYRVRYHLIANSETNLSLSYRDVNIGETKVSKSAENKYTTVDGQIIVLSKGLNTLEVTNTNGGSVNISHIELVPVTDSEVVNLNPVKKELDFNNSLNVKDAIEQNANCYYPDQNVAYLATEKAFMTYKVNSPERGEYTLNLKDVMTESGKDLNLISNFIVLNLTNNKLNNGDKIYLEKGENKLKVLVKAFDGSYINNVSISENGVNQAADKYETQLLTNQGENIKVEGSKVGFNGLNSYIDLSINNKTQQYKNVTIDLQGQGEFVITNQYSGAVIYGPSSIENVIDMLNWCVRTETPSRNMMLDPGMNIIRITPQNNGHLLNIVDVKRYFKEIIGYN